MSKIDLHPTDSLSKAAKKVFLHHWNDFLKYERHIRSDDAETVHDMRVTTRRMRAAITVFEAGFAPNALDFLKSGLGNVAKNLGVVRDFDVFIEKFMAYQQELAPSEQSEITFLLEYCHLQRSLAKAKLLDYFDGKKYKKFKNRATVFLVKGKFKTNNPRTNSPIPYQIRHVAPLLIYSSYEAIRAYEPFFNDVSLKLLHQLRIDFKYFRYTLENFQEILGDESVRVIDEIKAIQDYLGDLNDAGVASQFLDNFIKKGLATHKGKKSHVVKNYLEFKNEERKLLLDTFPMAWHDFNSVEMRRNLALAIAVL